MKGMLSRLKAELRAPAKPHDALLIAAQVLLYTALVAAIVTMVMTVGSLIEYGIAHAAQFTDYPIRSTWRPIAQMLLGLGALSLLLDIFVHLLRMIRTVSRGEALAEDNAGRLESIAMRMLGLQIVGFIGWALDAPVRGDVNGFGLALDLSPGGIAIVLLLFILARVFRQGASMRHDLEGTV